MKKLENKKTELPFGDKTYSYSDLIKAVLNVAPAGGFGIEDIKTRLKITDIIEKSNGEIQLEDSHYDYLKPLIKSFRWGVLHNDIVQFNDDFEKAEKQ